MRNSVVKTNEAALRIQAVTRGTAEAAASDRSQKEQHSVARLSTDVKHIPKQYRSLYECCNRV